MERILFVLTSHDRKGDTGLSTGFYLSEVTHPHKVLVASGFTIDFVSPKGGEPPIDGLDLEDPVNRAFMNNNEYLSQIKTTLRPEQIDPRNYQAIHYAGGHGTMWGFPDNVELARIAGAIYESGGIVSAVCHGPAGLVNVRLSNGSPLVEGQAVTAFTNEEEEAVEMSDVVPFLLESRLKSRGAYFSKAEMFSDHVVASDRLITGQNPASALGVGEAVLNRLKGGA